MVAEGRCSRCNEETETVEHVLRSCSRVAVIWYKLIPEENFYYFMNLDWESWLRTNLPVACGGEPLVHYFWGVLLDIMDMKK